MKNADTKTYTVTVTKLPQSRVELKGEIIWDHMATFEDAAFAKLSEHIQMDGFRKGNVPKDIARTQIPDELVLSDMAELAINSVYPQILAEEKLDVIGRPEVSLTKLARNNPLGFTITVAIVPPITLPDYKKIASGVALEDAKMITDADVDKVVSDLQQMRAYGHVHGEHDDHTHEEKLPEADDMFAQSFGNFKTIDAFRAKIRENLMLEADHATKDKRRITIMEEIVKETSFEIPEIVLDSEKQKMLATIEADVARNGASLEDYLKHIQKTKEEVMAEFAPEAEKRARFQLVLNAIAREAHIVPTAEEVEAEAQKYMTMYPGADHARTVAYADMMITNEKVLALIEAK